MHMADALLSPAVGGTMWAISAAGISICSVRVRDALEDRKVPLMGVLGAFVFAAQMVNFSIPGTGSSGHLGGALLLAILLGPCAGFLTMASVLVVQALFFADGGLLALGCNIFNIALIPTLLVYPLLFVPLLGPRPGTRRSGAVTVLSAIAASQLGSLGVGVETVLSGISALPLSTFLLLMQPLHLAAGLIEGGVTVALVSFLRQARPDAVPVAAGSTVLDRKLLLATLACAIITAGGLSCYASNFPDRLEWVLGDVTATTKVTAPSQLQRTLNSLQKKTALFPDYMSPSASAAKENSATGNGTSVAGITGTSITLVIVFLTALLMRRKAKPASP